ncbi:MAG: hypothetical protein HOW73_18905 [Polyangiaceae bacterium]|nr:hypothetical protein [Polyangiaceae bacterium]
MLQRSVAGVGRIYVGAILFAFVGVLALQACGDDDDDGDCECPGAGGTATTTTGTGGSTNGETVPLKEAKLNIEHNATDLDTGFQGFIDSEGWQRLDVTGPDGTVLTLEGKGELGALGLTELFFESVEPENAEVPIEEILATLPEGNYTIKGPTPDGGVTEGTALLTHDIPAGPVLMSPAEGETVPREGLVMTWEPVTETITGEPIDIIAYQLIVERDEEPHPHALSKHVMSVHVGPMTTSVSVPREFLEEQTNYAWEVLAIEESGNQTLSSGTFSTE